MNDYLSLKWGTINGYCFKNSPQAFEALKEYNDIGMSMSRAMQNDTPRQKELICLMIDNVNGEVSNDWSGEVYNNKEDAKKYVMEYGLK